MTIFSEKAKLKRRLTLLDDTIDFLIRSNCMFFACQGATAPPRDMITCNRCRLLHRAIQMGLVTVGDKSLDTYKQFSVINGEEIP